MKWMTFFLKSWKSAHWIWVYCASALASDLMAAKCAPPPFPLPPTISCHQHQPPNHCNEVSRVCDGFGRGKTGGGEPPARLPIVSISSVAPRPAAPKVYMSQGGFLHFCRRRGLVFKRALRLCYGSHRRNSVWGAFLIVQFVPVPNSQRAPTPLTCDPIKTSSNYNLKCVI